MMQPGPSHFGLCPFADYLAGLAAPYGGICLSLSDVVPQGADVNACDEAEGIMTQPNLLCVYGELLPAQPKTCVKERASGHERRV